jgi:hypothetical protein
MSFDETFGPYKGKTSREKIVNYIKKNYADVLGTDVVLLDDEDGLSKIQRKYFRK